jgi:hypothetical protein
MQSKQSGLDAKFGRISKVPAASLVQAKRRRLLGESGVVSCVSLLPRLCRGYRKNSKPPARAGSLFDAQHFKRRSRDLIKYIRRHVCGIFVGEHKIYVCVRKVPLCQDNFDEHGLNLQNYFLGKTTHKG